jgi:phosphatidate cytidylyltransferase
LLIFQEGNDVMELQNKFEGLQARIISAAVMAIMALTCLSLGGMFFIGLIMLAALQMIREWDSITLNENIIWRLAGLAYVALPCASLVWLRGLDGGFGLVLSLFLAIWATDIGAYFAGRLVGGPKLAPQISPNKTWAGLFGGMIAAAIALAIATSFSTFPKSAANALLIGILLALFGQIGDLFESWLKRRAGVKDSSNLIPGHGGLLDRVDGIILTAPLYALLVSVA